MPAEAACQGASAGVTFGAGFGNGSARNQNYNAECEGSAGRHSLRWPADGKSGSFWPTPVSAGVGMAAFFYFAFFHASPPTHVPAAPMNDSTLTVAQTPAR